MPFILSPNHVQLISACYPPSSALLSAGPDYRPNAQELSRLTYYATNHPGKLAKLSGELQKRAISDARKAQSGNARARASLLITLAIFRSLVNECRRDIALLSLPLISTLEAVLSLLISDLEVCDISAHVFSCWATLTNGQVIGADGVLTTSYNTTLRKFASLCLVESKSEDCEVRNRTRLIGLGALAGAVASNALYNSSTEFKQQVSIIVPALFHIVKQTPIDELDQQLEMIRRDPVLFGSYLTLFRARPPLERRTPSIHAHVDGDKGPSSGDVANSTLRALEFLYSQSNGALAHFAVRAALDSMDQEQLWNHYDHCCWFAKKAVEWIQYQYRYAVPMRIVDRLAEVQDESGHPEMQNCLVGMLHVVLTSPVPIANLSTSDILSNLVNYILHRVSIAPTETILHEVVHCIGALGTHIYYADQIHDLACELITRLVIVEKNGVATSANGVDKGVGRSTALRCLLGGLQGLMHSEKLSEEVLGPSVTIGDAVIRSSDSRPSFKRSHIPADIYQDTLSLLCDRSLPVRVDYARSLVAFLKNEIPREPSWVLVHSGVEDASVASNDTDEDPLRLAHNVATVSDGNNTVHRFLNALCASIYVLATSSTLGLQTSRTPSPAQSTSDHTQPPLSIHVVPSTPQNEETTPVVEESSETSQNSRRSQRRSVAIPPRSRKHSIARRLLDQIGGPTLLKPSRASVADYTHIHHVLTAAVERLPARSILCLVPMLVALQLNFLKGGEPEQDLKRASIIRELIAKTWLAIGNAWDCHVVAHLAFKVIPPHTSFPQVSLNVGDDIPLDVNEPGTGIDNASSQEVPLDFEAAIAALASLEALQTATSLDGQALLARLQRRWSPEWALRESIERPSKQAFTPTEGINPVLKISSALMHIENLSLQSLSRSSRGVGVNDLREALEGRGGMSNLAVNKPSSIYSFENGDHSGASGDSRYSFGVAARAKKKKNVINSDSPSDVRDALSKLGIGTGSGHRQSSSRSLSPLHNSSPGALIPPYKS